MIKCKFSKERILETIEILKEQTDKTFLNFCASHGDDHSITKHIYERCRTMNELINRLTPEPKKQYKKKGASKILNNINK